MEYNNELYHYGVKGMRWGHRKAQKYESKARLSRESAKEWDEMADYAQSRGKTRRAEKYRQNAKDDRRDASAYDTKAANMKKQVSNTKSAIKKYRNKFNEAERASNAADKQWAEVQAKYKALGKNKVSRMLAAANGKSAAAKAYNKSYDKWSKMDSIAETKWSEVKSEYKNTGRNQVERILNNMEYDRKR